MPTLIEYLATRNGRLFLLSEGYTLKSAVNGDYINSEKLGDFRMADMERLIPLFDESIEWTVEDERQAWDSAMRNMYIAIQSEVTILYECDQNADVYIKLLDDPETDAFLFQFYNKADDTESDYAFTTDHFTMNCWQEYTP